MTRLSYKIIAAVVLLTAIIISSYEIGVHRYQSDYQRQTDNLTTALAPTIIHDTIRDSVPVASTGVIDLKPKELKSQNLYDKQLISDLQLKVKQLQAVQNTSSVTSQTVTLRYDSDTTYNYVDKWTDLRLNLNTKQLALKSKDSITQIVYAEYKHHFLWWRWGIRGFRVKIVNFNPHTFVTYNQYIRLK
jgi:hypothetical protein